MRRREFIGLVGGAAAWPLAARAQQGERMRRIGVLMLFDENDPEARALLSGFRQGLAELGWTDGRNLRMDVRGTSGNVDRMGMSAKELLELTPDVVLAHGIAAAAFQRETRTIPIVFAAMGDPVASGIVASLSRPGGNTTGFALWEASLGGKWLELLSEIAPGLKRAAIMFNPDTVPVPSLMPSSFETGARSLKVEPIIVHVHSEVEIETAIIALGREPGGGLVVIPDPLTLAHRKLVISAAARNNIPAVYPASFFAREGGLLSYGADPVDIWRRAASYVDRILRGAKPSELPVQFPTKFEMVLNLKTAKALGLAVPPSIWLRADEVIE
jgi:putative ABC transport system substrate-binding protein